jgi:hypothetical protein
MRRTQASADQRITPPHEITAQGCPDRSTLYNGGQRSNQGRRGLRLTLGAKFLYIDGQLQFDDRIVKLNVAGAGGFWRVCARENRSPPQTGHRACGVANFMHSATAGIHFCLNR